MNSTRILASIIFASLALSGCSSMLNSMVGDQQKLEQIVKDRERLRATGGDELAQDYDAWVVIAQPAKTLAYKRPSGVNDTKGCLFNYSDILEQLKNDQEIYDSTWSESRSLCVVSSNSNESQELVTISDKYIQKIEQLRQDYQQGDANKILSALVAQAEAASAPLVLYWSLDYADEQVIETAEKLGQEHATVADYRSKFAQVREARDADWQQADTFLQRDDIKALKQQIQAHRDAYNTHSKKYTAFASAYRNSCHENAAGDDCASLQAKIIEEDSAKISVKRQLDDTRSQRDKLAIEAGVLGADGWPEFDVYFD